MPSSHRFSGFAGVPVGANVQALHVITTTGANSIYARKNVSLTDLWVRVNVKWVANIPDSILEYTGVIVSLDDIDGDTHGDGWYIGWLFPGGPTGWSTKWQSEPFFTTPTVNLDQWYQVDLHYATGTPTTNELWVDDVDKTPITSGDDTSTVTSMSFGTVGPGGWETAYEVYICNIKVGTSRGATDIWAPTLASLAEFDSTVNPDGTIEVVNIPGP